MDICIEPRKTPVCACGKSDWSVIQQIERSSRLIRVDGLSDLVVEKPDLLTSRQSLMLACVCGQKYTPQAGIEAWYEDGGEDGFGWIERTANN